MYSIERSIILKPVDKPSLSLEIRRCNARDFASIMLAQACVFNSVKDKATFVLTTEAELAESLEEDVCFGAYCGSEPVAFSIMVSNRICSRNLGSYLGYANEQLCRCVTYDTTFVVPEFRGYGIQKLFCGIRDNAALSLGAIEALVTVSPDNVASLNNLLRCGFSLADEREMYGGFRRFILRKDLLGELFKRGVSNGPRYIS